MKRTKGIALFLILMLISVSFLVDFVTILDKDIVVTMNLNYTGAPTVKTKNVKVGKAYGKLPELTRTNFTFLGWFDTNNASGNKITADTIVLNNEYHTIWARWQGISSVTISFETGSNDLKYFSGDGTRSIAENKDSDGKNWMKVAFTESSTFYFNRPLVAGTTVSMTVEFNKTASFDFCIVRDLSDRWQRSGGWWTGGTYFGDTEFAAPSGWPYVSTAGQKINLLFTVFEDLDYLIFNIEDIAIPAVSGLNMYITDIKMVNGDLHATIGEQ